MEKWSSCDPMTNLPFQKEKLDAVRVRPSQTVTLMLVIARPRQHGAEQSHRKFRGNDDDYYFYFVFTQMNTCTIKMIFCIY